MFNKDTKMKFQKPLFPRITLEESIGNYLNEYIHYGYLMLVGTH